MTRKQSVYLTFAMAGFILGMMVNFVLEQPMLSSPMIEVMTICGAVIGVLIAEVI